MRFELNLLENSHDYVENSLDLYKIADEYGLHDEQRTNIENKKKWKLAFVTLVQAFELLLKEALYRIHPNLIYEDIDADRIAEKKTVTFTQALNRLSNLNKNPIEDERKTFIAACAKIRNDFVHYRVDIQSEQFKSKYCMLYKLYKEFHNKYIGEDIVFASTKHMDNQYEILQYDENWTVYRGREIRKDQLEEFKKEIEENSIFKYYVSVTGERIERIKYGDEINRVSQEFRDTHELSLYSDFEICDDCNAKRGEFHLEECDLEICPFCYSQARTCGCIDLLETC